MGVPFTVSTSFSLIRSDSTARKTLLSVAQGQGDLGEESYLTLRVPTGAVEQAINLGGVSLGKFFYLSTSENVTVVINRVIPSNGEGTPLVAGGFAMLLACNVSTLHISNSSGSEAVIEIYVAG